MSETLILDASDTITDADSDTETFAPKVTITSSRVTVDGNTFSLSGVDRVSREVNCLRMNNRAFWVGWLMIVASIFLFPLLQLTVAPLILGIMVVWSSRKKPYYTVQIFIHKGRQRQLVYSDYLGSPDRTFLQRTGCLDERIERLLRIYELKRQRSSEIMEALAKALGSRT